MLSLFDKVQGYNVGRSTTTFFFYSKTHNVWFIANCNFIQNYDPSKSFKDTVIQEDFRGEEEPADGLFAIYNKDERSAYILLYNEPLKKTKQPDDLTEIDPSTYEKYHCFYKIPNIEMTPTRFLQGCINETQQDCDMNFRLDYSHFMNSISHTSYKKKPHYKIEAQRGIIKGPDQRQTIPNPGNEFIDLMIRTSDTYNDEPIFALSVPYPKFENTYLKFGNENNLKSSFTDGQIWRIRYEKYYSERTIGKLGLNHFITNITDKIVTYVFTECCKFTKQKMKKNSCMWNVGTSSDMYVYSTRCVVESLLMDLFTNICEDIVGLFKIDHFVDEVYKYLVSKEGIIISYDDDVWKFNEQMQKFYSESLKKIEKFKQVKYSSDEKIHTEINLNNWSLQKNIDSKFKQTIKKKEIEHIIIEAFNKRFPKLVKSESVSEGGGGGGGGGGSIFATE